MKYLIVILGAIFISINSQAQLEVQRDNSKTIYENAGRQTLKQIVLQGDTTYMFMFQDKAYTQLIDIKSINFSNRAELDQFLSLAIDVMNGGEAVTTEKYAIYQASKKWVDVSNGIGSFYLKRTTIEDIKEALKSL